MLILFGGGAGGAAVCVVCHPGDTDLVGKALVDDQLHLHQEYFHAAITFEQEPNSFQQVTRRACTFSKKFMLVQNTKKMLPLCCADWSDCGLWVYIHPQ